jgi:WRC
MIKNKQTEGKTSVAREKKAMRNSAVLLEGSRCSRVNGRGWRCCQPTLVGYLLCEHHLGKGRTRNMSNSNRGQLGCTASKRNLSESGSTDEAVRKKRNIVPTIKARSISSLLDDGAGH